MTALSPLQLVCSNSHRFMPSQADEEAHQLSYLQKNLENILLLLGEHVEGQAEESLVFNCHDSVIYILAPLGYGTIYGCSDTTVVLGAVGKAVRVEHCEQVYVITAAKRVCIANCRECVFFLGVNQRPIITGENHKLQVAPYNTFYSQLGKHMKEVGIHATIKRWSEPMALGAVDPHDFIIPSRRFQIWIDGESGGSIENNPFVLPDVYLASQQRNQKNLAEMKQNVEGAAS